MQILSRLQSNRGLCAIAALTLLPFLINALRDLLLRIKILRHNARAPPRIPSWLPYSLDVVLHIGKNPNHTLELWDSYRRKLGPTFQFVTPGRKMILVYEPECVQHFLAKNFDNYEKGPVFQSIFRPLLGNGIFNANGEQWKYARSTARPHFQSIELGQMIPTFSRHAHKLTEVLGGIADARQTVDIQDLCFRFTLDSVGEILFGTNINSLEHPSIFAQAFDYIQGVITQRFLTHPIWLLQPDPNFKIQLEILDGFVDQLVEKALADPNIHLREDLLAEYIKDSKAAHSKESLRDMLKNMLIAGRDTTAVLITWTLAELSSRPDIQEKLLDEIKEVIGDSEKITSDQLNRLRYMKQVLNEALRLHPSVPIDLRTAIKDDVLPNGVFVEAGTDVVFQPFVMHRMKEYWGEDAERFDPDRWLPDRISKVKNFVFNPFLAGPRICLGQNMAYTEAKIFLAIVLRQFKMTLRPDMDMDYRHAIILQVKNGLYMNVERR